MQNSSLLSRLEFETPFTRFSEWLNQASVSEINDPNAMTLSTVNAQGMPNARIVLLKGHDNQGFRFFTNYNSVKGQELSHSGKAALVFHWKSLERQVRIQGLTEPLSAKDSDTYYQSRPRGSQLSAWASDQSKPLPGGSSQLQQQISEQEKRFKDQEIIPRPEYWGGFILRPLEIEFWQAGAFRVHERERWARQSITDRTGWIGGALWP